jgi:hypothetical protein
LGDAGVVSGKRMSGGRGLERRRSKTESRRIVEQQAISSRMVGRQHSRWPGAAVVTSVGVRVVEALELLVIYL